MNKLVEPGNSIFEELNSQFGVISLHTATQRLAVSLPDNSIVVYDLRNGNKITQLQGHMHSCTLIAFNTDRCDGKQLLSYSVGEACVRWWSVSSTSSGRELELELGVRFAAVFVPSTVVKM